MLKSIYLGQLIRSIAAVIQKSVDARIPGRCRWPCPNAVLKLVKDKEPKIHYSTNFVEINVACVCFLS